MADKQPPNSWITEVLSVGVKRPGVKLTTHLHLVPRLGMRGAVLLAQYVFMALCLIKQIRLYDVLS
jgi:hypothetical protein